MRSNYAYLSPFYCFFRWCFYSGMSSFIKAFINLTSCSWFGDHPKYVVAPALSGSLELCFPSIGHYRLVLPRILNNCQWSSLTLIHSYIEWFTPLDWSIQQCKWIYFEWNLGQCLHEGWSHFCQIGTEFVLNVKNKQK